MAGARRGEADAPAEVVMLGVEPAREDQPGGFPYFIRQYQSVSPEGCCLHLATGIQRLADAELMAAAHDLAEVLLRLPTSPDLMCRDVDSGTRAATTKAWDLLVQVVPHLEI